MARSAYASMSAQEQDHWWFFARRAIIDRLVRAHVPLPSDARILEAGSGTGGNLALLAQYGALDAMEYDEDEASLRALGARLAERTAAADRARSRFGSGQITTSCIALSATIRTRFCSTLLGQQD